MRSIDRLNITTAEDVEVDMHEKAQESHRDVYQARMKWCTIDESHSLCLFSSSSSSSPSTFHLFVQWMIEWMKSRVMQWRPPIEFNTVEGEKNKRADGIFLFVSLYLKKEKEEWGEREGDELKCLDMCASLVEFCSPLTLSRSFASRRHRIEEWNMTRSIEEKLLIESISIVKCQSSVPSSLNNIRCFDQSDIKTKNNEQAEDAMRLAQHVNDGKKNAGKNTALFVCNFTGFPFAMDLRRSRRKRWRKTRFRRVNMNFGKRATEKGTVFASSIVMMLINEISPQILRK